jgi:hypothetical protein
MGLIKALPWKYIIGFVVMYHLACYDMPMRFIVGVSLAFGLSARGSKGKDEKKSPKKLFPLTLLGVLAWTYFAKGEVMHVLLVLSSGLIGIYPRQAWQTVRTLFRLMMIIPRIIITR